MRLLVVDLEFGKEFAYYTASLLKFNIMLKRKNPKLELESKRKVFFQLGLFIVGSATLMAFTYKSPVYLKNKKESAKKVAEVPIMIVEKEKKTPIEIPKVEKLPTKEPSSPVFSLDLLNKIKLTKNKKKEEQIIVSTKKKIKTSFTIDTFDIGKAPEAAIVEYPDFDAKFQGDWLTYLKKNMKYPEESRRFNESGTAYVGFVVEKDGTITDVEVKNKSLSENLQKEAVRVVKASPQWKPGIKDGEFVRSTKIVKINFILN